MTIKLKPTENQKAFICSIVENTITVCSGFAGTGKTIFAVITAVNQLKQGTINQIIITRPLTCVGRNIGSLPGSLQERSAPYFAHVEDYFKEILEKEYYTLLKQEVIKYVPTELMRGHTYDDAIIIVEESQNLSIHQMKTVISRIGKNSKCVISGDVTQKDTDSRETNGLLFCMNNFEKPPLDKVGVVRLGYEDIKRNPHIQHILRIFDENNY